MDKTYYGNGYIPKPVDVTDIELSGDLDELMEAIAKNVHEVWALGRINDGWTYGEVRDCEKKETPCLIPYEDLSEEEKNFDRMTAMGTLKFILKAGYKITK